MNLMKTDWRGVLALVAAPFVVGCSSDSDSKTGEALTSCKAYCEATIAASCQDSGRCRLDQATNTWDECAGLDQTTGACDAAMKAYFDCQKAQSDVCTTGTCTLDASTCR